jgi:GTP-binding protein EngB required for normal cell division
MGAKLCCLRVKQSCLQAQQSLPRAEESLPQVELRAPNVQFRVLIIGRANSGKTSILQRVCDTTESPLVYRLGRRGRREQVRNIF